MSKDRAWSERGGWFPELDGLDGFSRRRFIKTALAAAAAAQLPAWDRLLEASPLGAKPPLILYDGRGEFAWVARLHAEMLANLLGRFLPLGARRNNTRRKPVERYHRGDIDRHAVTFYIGNTYDNPLPPAFKDDVMKASRPVCWFKYNLHQIAWTPDGTAWSPAFTDRVGFAFLQLSTREYPTVCYKGESFGKFQDVPLTSGEMGSEIGQTQNLRGNDKKWVKAWIHGPAQDERWPYILQGANNLWYVADLPFSFISEEDRYLVFADVLFDMLGIDFKLQKRALVRIEDVSAISDPGELVAVADFLNEKGIPFAVSVIPFYRNTLGLGEGPRSLPLNRAPEVVKALHYMVDRGGEIVMHGLTHQLGRIRNPYDAVSADDYEFFRVTENADHTLNFLGPLRFDSARWVAARLAIARRIFRRARLRPFAFEVPNYAASELDFKIFARAFDLNYHRALYFLRWATKCQPEDDDDDHHEGHEREEREGHGEEHHDADDHDHEHDDGDHDEHEKHKEHRKCKASELKWAGQFFPYPIVRDVYRQKLLPENLGGISPEPWPHPDGPHPARSPEDILRAAKKNAVLRDAWASFYVNPSDLDQLKMPIDGAGDLLEELDHLGFDFVRPSDVEV